MFDTYYSFKYIMCEYPKGEPYEKLHRLTFRGFNRQRYMVLVEEYNPDIFALKFYLKAHSGSPGKYQLLTGFHDAPRLIRTCIEIFLYFFQKNNEASFCFIGSNLLSEPPSETKRYRVYSRVMQNFFSPIRFEHRFVPEKSLYLMLNKAKDMEHLAGAILQILDNYRFG